MSRFTACMHLIVDNEPSVEVCRERIQTALECAIDELEWSKQWLEHVDSGLLTSDLEKAVELVSAIKAQVSP